MSVTDEHSTEGAGQRDAIRRAERKRKGWVLLGVALLLAGMALVFLGGWVKYRRVRTCASSTLVRLRTLQGLVPEGATTPAALDLAGAGAQLQGLQADLTCLRTELKPFVPLAARLGWLPKVGPDIANAPVLLDMAQALVDGGVVAFDGLTPLIEPMRSGELDLAIAVPALNEARPALAAAEVELERAVALQEELEGDSLFPQVGRLLDLTGRYLPLMHSGIQVAQVAPELLGAEGPRTYLVLAQNDYERRPTGGWISGVGLLTVDQGKIVDFSFQDSYAVDNYEVPHDIPPESMFRALWAEIWLLRDSNWSPDFPSAAQVAERILERDQGVAVDGVIAVDQQALQLLVAGLQPLILEGSEEVITGANVRSIIRESWSEPVEGLTPDAGWQDWEAHRKDIMADLVSAMMDKVQNQAGEIDLTQLVTGILQGLQERHILIYLHEAQVAELLAARHWDGALRSFEGDYLQVVDANVGFNKVDPNVKRAIVYQVDLTDPAQPEGAASVVYQNQSPPEEETCIQEAVWEATYLERMEGCYWNYVRFYVPQGTQLLETERVPLPSGSLLSQNRFASLEDAGPKVEPVEKDKGAFGLFFDLAPGQEQEVRLPWQLPAETVQRVDGNWRYRLLVQKQSGTPAIPLRVEITLPPGSRIVATSPEPFSVQADVVAFESQLSEDQLFEVVFEDGSDVHSSNGQGHALRISGGRRPC
jgi:hypothetical protein